MERQIDRRDFLRLAGYGGVVFASSIATGGCASPGASAGGTGAAAAEFHFVQLSDLHWGFEGPPNPDARGTLPKAIAAVNGLAQQPDFVVFTGDLTHSTDDPKERRVRMTQVREHIAKLNVPAIHFMPGEHDASLDRGEAFQEFFGKTHYTFDHKGVHFIVLDNVSDPSASIGDEQLAWLTTDLSDRPRNAPIVVLTHRPLFEMYPQWDWATRDGAKAIALLEPFEHVTVFYGHIHQEHHQMTGRIAHHAAKSLMFPLPAPGSQPKRTPIPWDASSPYRGLGWRDVEADASRAYYELKERSVQGA
ncbi:MAG TPA: metallophosphoesterase [Burkholderiaceae bacterium]|jgi:3',5'-cyclic AMP phosphodiesterase CpdA|nr:metallophosphoesterase [Burkholderiaceae bacterium]